MWVAWILVAAAASVEPDPPATAAGEPVSAEAGIGTPGGVAEDEEAPPAGKTESVVPGATGAGPSELDADTAGDRLEERVRRRRRQKADALLAAPDPGHYGDPGVAAGEASFIGEERPAVLRPRWPGGALALGGLVGFGSGYYYAGSPRWGLVFTLVDAVLVGGFVASTVELNSLVVKHDFSTGKSLARAEREMTQRERRWYTASILLALVEVGSRAFQAFGGLRTARRTNAALASFSFVPLGEGGGMLLQLEW
jgi:hypothetical protein